VSDFPADSNGPRRSRNAAPRARSRWRTWTVLAALFLVTLGARLWLVETYGNDLPYWDQWDGEAGEILKPWLDGQLTFATLLLPHAEHRVVLTRALALGLVAANGQWDGRLEMAVNALLCAGIAVGLAAALRHALAPRLGNTSVLGVAGLFCLPFAWENTLTGFQSQFYFLLGNSLLALWGLGTRRPWTLGWWLGALGAGLACVSMASGLLAAAAVLGFGVVRAARDRRWPGIGQMFTWLFCLAVIAVSWQHRVDVPQHAVFRVESAGAAWRALGRCLAWPRVTSPGWAPLNVLPLALLAGFWWQRRRRQNASAAAPDSAEDRADHFLLLLAGWIALQAAAMAYVRGGGELPPASRYMDLLAHGALLSLLAAALLASRQPRGTRRRVVAWSGAALWTLWLLVGVAKLTARNFSDDLPLKREHSRVAAANTRAYVLTGDRSALDRVPATEAFVPYPNIPYLVALLDDPKFRGVLPAGIRPPLHLEPSGDGNAAQEAVEHSFRENALPPAVADAPPATHVFGSFLDDAGGAAAQSQLSGLLVPSPTLPYLQLAFTGDLGRPGLRLWLRDEHTGEETELHPGKVPGDRRWRTEFLPVPSSHATDPLRLLAEDCSATCWFAFQEPVEVGRLSYWSGWLLRRGWLIFYLGAAVGLAAMGSAEAWRKMRTPRLKG